MSMEKWNIYDPLKHLFDQNETLLLSILKMLNYLVYSLLILLRKSITGAYSLYVCVRKIEPFILQKIPQTLWPWER